MKMDEFTSLIGKDVDVEYNFNGIKCVFNMKNFYIDKDGKIKRNKLKGEM